MMRLATFWASPKASRGRPRSVDGVDDVAGEIAAQLVAALAADRQHLDRLALGQQRADGAARLAHDRAVEGAAQAAVGGGDDHRCTSSLPVPASSLGPVPPLKRGAERGQHALHALGIGPGRLGLLLRAAQLGRGHHLHGRGDLLRRLDAADPVPQVLETGHGEAGDPLGEGLGEVVEEGVQLVVGLLDDLALVADRVQTSAARRAARRASGARSSPMRLTGMVSR